jgi:hypothetical protein
VQHAGDLHLGGGIAGHRGKQDAAQRIAERVAVAALKGSMITFACVGDRFWTSMMRGFRKFVALLCMRDTSAKCAGRPPRVTTDYFE